MSRMIDDEEALQDNGLIEVDGVDVSGCINISIGETYDIDNIICNDYPDCLCSDFSDCYYKQLQRLKAENEKLKQALEEIREIINFRFKTPYMKLGLKETDKIIEDIEKIINEVLKSENH